MSSPKPSATAFWILESATSSEFQPLVSLAVQILGTKLPHLSLEECSDRAEEQLEAIVQQLENEREKQREEGIEPTFELSYDAGTPYFRARPTQALEFLNELLALKDRQFVDFCVSLLSALGGEALNIDGTNDGGVDFVARNLPISSAPWAGLRKTRLLVVGQAKHYGSENLVTEPEMRDFVGGALKRISDHTDSIAHRGSILAPVVFAFWTTSNFNINAKAFANSVGIWMLSGVALAQLALQVGLRPDGSKENLPPNQ